MVQIKNISLFLLLLCLRFDVNSEKNNYGRALPEVSVVNDFLLIENLRLNGTLQQAAKKYQCHLEDIPNTELLLYGAKAWTFPIQDVNLTLQYPSENLQDIPDHIITGVTVILYLDGFDNGGYIKSGGMLEDNIVMSFILNNTSRLSYQFWLYGISKSVYNLTSHSHYRGLC